MKIPSTDRSFRDDYGVFACDHIFRKTLPVRLSVRAWDGTWQFLCGGELAEDEVHLVHVGELLDWDASLRVLAALDPGMYAERAERQADWTVGALSPEHAGSDGV